MKSLLSAVGCMLALGIAATAAHAQSMGDHQIIRPDDVKWSAASPMLQIPRFYRTAFRSKTGRDSEN